MLDLAEIGPRAFQLVVRESVTPAELTRVLDEVGDLKRQVPKFDLLVDVDGHVSVDAGALAAEFVRLPLLLGLLGALDRVALVADDHWVRMAGKVQGKLLFMLDYRSFDRIEMDAARAWIRREE